MSASLRLLSLLTAATAPSLSPHLLSSSSALSGDRGKNQKGMAEMNMKPDEMRKPIHQAPTQRASFGVMATLSEQHKSFCLNAQQEDCVLALLSVYFNDIRSTWGRQTQQVLSTEKNDHWLSHYWLKSQDIKQTSQRLTHVNISNVNVQLGTKRAYQESKYVANKHNGLETGCKAQHNHTSLAFFHYSHDL